MREMSAPQYSTSIRLGVLGSPSSHASPLSPREPSQEERAWGVGEGAGSQRAFPLGTHLVTSHPTLWASSPPL